MTMQAENQARAATGGIRQSRTGKRPIPLPKGVSANVKDGAIEVKGPKGALTRALPPSVSVQVEGGRLSVMPTWLEPSSRAW
jgi:large subunit ribosomal protein L6